MRKKLLLIACFQGEIGWVVEAETRDSIPNRDLCAAVQTASDCQLYATGGHG